MASDSDFARSPEATEAAFNSSPDAILLVDAAGIIRRANHQAIFMLGYPEPVLTTMTVEDLIPERLRDIHRGHRARFAHEPRSRPMGLGLPLIATVVDGTEVPIDAALAPMGTPEGTWTVVTIRHRPESEAERRVPQLFSIISGKNPFQAWLMAFFMLVTVPLLFSAPAPNSIQALVPKWAVFAWAASFALAATANLIGVYWRGLKEIGTFIEFTSCIVLAVSNLLYPMAIFVFAVQRDTTSSSWFSIGLLVGLSVCSIGRAFQLQRDRKEISQIRRALGQMEARP